MRTGWTSWYGGLTRTEREAVAGPTFASPGLSGPEALARLLWNLLIAAIAADNPALEVIPPVGMAEGDHDRPFDEVFAHLRILPLLGLPIGEMWDLEALAIDCATDGVWEGLLTSAPLN